MSVQIEDYQTVLGESFGKLFEKRLQNNQDIIILIDDEHNRRGTGKTSLSVGLAAIMDQTKEGLTKNKVTMTAAELMEAYVEQPKGSALILDEAEQAVSKYRAASSTNMAVRKLASMGREPLQKFVVINLPNSMELDRDLKALCTVWCMVTQKGHAVVHFLGMNKYRNKVLTPKKHSLNWTALSDPDLQEITDYLGKQKLEILEDGEDQYIDPEDHEQELEQIKNQTQTEVRNSILRDVYSSTDLTQEELANSVGLSRSRVADILNS
jgi:predicted XRE-type DNA-binding protein